MSSPQDHADAAPGTVYNPFAYNATDDQLENMLFTALVVAGKTARVQQDKLAQFYYRMRKKYRAYMTSPPGPATPSQQLRRIDCLNPNWIEQALRAVKMGQYTRLTKAFKYVASRVTTGRINLRTCTPEQLEEIPGIGMKSSRFFILFTRKEARVACLDVHILKYLRETGLAPHAPRATPSRKLYLELEQVFLAHAEALNRAPAELDFSIWLEKNRGDKPRSI